MLAFGLAFRLVLRSALALPGRRVLLVASGVLRSVSASPEVESDGRAARRRQQRISTLRKAVLGAVLAGLLGAGPAWGADIMFGRDGALWVANRDGNGQREIDSTPPSDGTRLTADGTSYVEVRPNRDVWETDISGGADRFLYTLPNHFWHPEWLSQDGRYLYLRQDDGSTSALHRARLFFPRTTSLWASAPAGQQILGLTFSADEQRASFLIQRPGCSVLPCNTIWAANGNGTGQRPIDTSSVAPRGLGGSNPQISPNGTTIAFTAPTDDWENQIYLVNWDGTNPRQITNFSNGQFSIERLTWSPTGSRIGFSWQRPDGGDEFRTIRPDGTDLRTVLTDAAGGEFRQPPPLVAAPYRFRPTLRFDSAETYRPVDVDYFLGEANDEGGPLHSACSGGAGCHEVSSSEDLWGDYLDIAGNGDADNYHSPYDECTVGDLRDCDAGRGSAIYYWETPGTTEHGPYIDYWIFYRYNDWPFVSVDEGSDHEGDWENVSIAPSALDSDTFDYASMSQHGHWYSYLRENLSCDGGGPGSCGTETSKVGQRIDIFVSKGSHANYADQCDDSIFTSCLRNDHPEIADGSRNGEAPWGNDSLDAALLPFPNPADEFSWAAWPGDWGAPPEFAPNGPAHGSNAAHFYLPWIYECARGNDPCPREPWGGARAAQHDDRTGGNDRCSTWLGGDVTAVACNPAQIRAAVLGGRLRRRGTYQFDSDLSPGRAVLRSQASAPGLAQALGAPLRPGQSLTLRGPTKAGTELLVRAATDFQVVEARFQHLPAGPSSVIIAADQHGGQPSVRAVLPSGRTLHPSSTRRARFRLAGRPRVRSMTRIAARLHLIYDVPGPYLHLELVRTPRGPAMRERLIHTSGRRARRASLKLPKGARHVRLTAFRRHGARSRTVVRRIPPRLP